MYNTQYHLCKFDIIDKTDTNKKGKNIEKNHRKLMSGDVLLAFEIVYSGFVLHVTISCC